MTEDTQISGRKADHILINLREDVLSSLNTGLEDYQLIHRALPEFALNSVDTSLEFLGKRLNAPILVSSMTGGTASAGPLNEILAIAAEEFEIALGVGSQRAAIRHPELRESFGIRRFAPSALIFANLGAVQLNDGWGLDEAQAAVDMVQADALILHLNPLQEAIQPEGDTDFSALLPKIGRLCRQLPVPVIAKEVGYGISGKLARYLVDEGVAVIDVAGAGGTSWSEVERYRLKDPALQASAARFRGWGIPTAECLRQVGVENIQVPVIASGGLENGIDLAKCLALGAKLGGYARAFLMAANSGQEAMNAKVSAIIRELRIAMFSTGAQNLSALEADKLNRKQ